MIGLFGGFIAGLAGIGTGFLLIVIIPIALQQLGIPSEEAVKFTIANTVFATMCSAFMNNVTTIRKQKFYKLESGWAAIAALVCAALLLQFAVLKSSYSQSLYNVIILLFLIYVVIRSILKLRANLHEKEKVTRPKLVVTGLAGGLVAAFTGLGGGSIVMPLLNLWLKIDIKKAKAITFTVIFSVAFILSLVNMFNEPTTSLQVAHVGYIILPIAIPLAAGVIIASPLGVLASHKTSSKVISYTFLSIIVLVIVRKTYELLY